MHRGLPITRRKPNKYHCLYSGNPIKRGYHRLPAAVTQRWVCYVPAEWVRSYSRPQITTAEGHPRSKLWLPAESQRRLWSSWALQSGASTQAGDGAGTNPLPLLVKRQMSGGCEAAANGSNCFFRIFSPGPKARSPITMAMALRCFMESIGRGEGTRRGQRRTHNSFAFY